VRRFSPSIRIRTWRKVWAKRVENVSWSILPGTISDGESWRHIEPLSLFANRVRR